MTGLGSLIGFGLVFWALCLAVSLVVSAGHRACSGWLRRQGAWVERRATALATLTPPLVAAIVTVALAAHSLLGPALGGADHCPGHGHHLHLCLRHGQAWASQPFAVALVAAFTALFVLRAAPLLAAHARTRLASRALARASWQPDPAQPLLRLVSDASPYCFAVGVRSPRIFMSTAAWDVLAPDERAAVLAHERAHLEQGDLWRRTVLGAAAVFGVPVLVEGVLRAWGHATERLCDRRAADEVGSPVAIAGALVTLARAGAGLRHGAAGAASFISGCSVVERVEAILAGGPDGRTAATWFGRAAVAGAIVLVVGVAALADPLHHLVETVLGAH